mgnify:CR=1 FL=1
MSQKLKQSLLKRKTELSMRRDGLITLRLNSEISAEEMKTIKSQINEQMEELESMVNPRVFKLCESDFDQIEIFKDIEELFIAHHEQLLN